VLTVGGLSTRLPIDPRNVRRIHSRAFPLPNPSPESESRIRVPNPVSRTPPTAPSVLLIWLPHPLPGTADVMKSGRAVDRPVGRCSVGDESVHERLRRAREAGGETAVVFARRIGVGLRLVLAIDEGRFADLPTGLYARAAIRVYAKALALDPDEILMDCEPLLTATEDPVTALARLRGLRPASTKSVPPPSAPRERPAVSVESHSPEGPPPFPPWRPLAAVAMDGLMVAALLVTAIAGTVTMSGAGPSSLGHAAAPVFGLMSAILLCCYFVFFGGIACATAGERLVGMRVGRRHASHVDPRMVAARAFRCAGRDLRYIVRLGVWTGAMIPSGPSGAGSESTPSIGHATGQ
jgi:hypothetical protein